MTTIAAVQGDGWAVIGVDSRVVEDSGRTYSLPSGQPKLVKRGPYMMSAAGDLRALNIIEHSFEPPAPGDRSGRKLDRFVSTSFVGELKDCFERIGYGKDNAHGAVVLVAVNGVLYEIGEDYSYMRDASGVYAAGSGGDYALGVLHALIEEPIDARDVSACRNAVKTALTIAAKLDNGTAGPFVIAIQHST